jgi:hypothetical protein
MIKNVNAYNVSSLLVKKLDKCVPIMYQQKCNLYETKQGKM